MRIFRNILSLLVLCALFILIFIPFFPPTVAGNFVFITLSAIPILLLAFMLTVWIWQSKAPIRWVLLVASLWSLYIVLSPRIGMGRSNEADPQSLALNVVCWNVDLFGGGYQDYTNLRPAAELIQQQHPDIICLQERPHTNVMSWDSIRAAFQEYPYYVKNTREDEVLNLVIFSRYPLENAEDHYFADTYNKFMQVDVELGTQIVRLFNVHLQTTGIGEDSHLIANAKKRNHQARELEQCVRQSPYPVIVCGDFNDTSTSYAYRAIAAHLQDAAKSASLWQWQGTFQPSASLLKIDHILCSKELKLQHYEVVSNGISDHKLQVSRFRV